MKRKDFIRLLAFTGLAPATFYCTPADKNAFPPTLLGPDSKTGHLLRDGTGYSSHKTEYIETLIIGGGIAGLTAAHTLSKNGIADYRLIELEKQPGGNSSYRQNSVSAYPLGAHYLPIPNLNQPAMIDFLADAGIITGFDVNGHPYYLEEYLCQEPEERLFIKNYWQEGLVPDYSVPETDKHEITDFFRLMKTYQTAIGTDGREAFCIPVALSSRDTQYLALDTLSFKTFLEQQGWKSEYLHWYVDYCLRDDFGTRYDETSAWMGIHYFASRKGISANAEKNDVLTWPEGNGKLADALRKKVEPHIRCQQMALHIDTDGKTHRVTFFDVAGNEYNSIECRNLVLAVPQFICHKILPPEIAHPLPQKIEYSPWLIANLTVKPLPEDGRGAPLSWDNVIYGSTGLGYVNACQQHQKTVHEKFVFTYYRPLLDLSPADMRKAIRNSSTAEWKKMVLDDLRTAHNNIEESLLDMEIYVTGHSMPQPRPGLMRQVLSLTETDADGIYFCHSDLAGYSIFEEAFYWGHRVAEKIIQKKALHAV